MLDVFRKLPVLSIYSSYGSFETKNVNEVEHDHVPLDHPTLVYILRNGDCKILELHAWGTVVLVLREIQTNSKQGTPESVKKIFYVNMFYTNNHFFNNSNFSKFFV